MFNAKLNIQISNELNYPLSLTSIFYSNNLLYEVMINIMHKNISTNLIFVLCTTIYSIKKMPKTKCLYSNSIRSLLKKGLHCSETETISRWYYLLITKNSMVLLRKTSKSKSCTVFTIDVLAR